VFASAGGRRATSASTRGQTGRPRDWLASARAVGKSPRTLETYQWPVYKLLLPACGREGIGSATQINQRFLADSTPELVFG